jgi:hypothetical protein
MMGIKEVQSPGVEKKGRSRDVGRLVLPTLAPNALCPRPNDYLSPRSHPAQRSNGAQYIIGRNTSVLPRLRRAILALQGPHARRTRPHPTEDKAVPSRAISVRAAGARPDTDSSGSARTRQRHHHKCRTSHPLAPSLPCHADLGSV